MFRLSEFFFFGIFYLNQKENENIVPSKKRRLNGLNPTGLEAENHSHEVLCSSNGHTEPHISQQNDSSKEWEEGRMASELVESLLSTKILGKSKFDLKVW